MLNKIFEKDIMILKAVINIDIVFKLISTWHVFYDNIIIIILYNWLYWTKFLKNDII